MGRRANGEGTVYQRKDGRWQAACYVGQADGTRVRVSRYAATRQAAQEHLVQLQAADAKMMPVAVDRTTTVGAYLTAWLEQVAVHKVRPTTYVSYTNYTNRYLIPGLGRRRLGALTPKEVRLWLTDVATTCQCCRQGWDTARLEPMRRCCAIGKCCDHRVKPATVKYLRALLSTALAHAVREDDLPRNVVTAVRLPEPRRSGFTPLTADEARRVLVAATYNRYHAVFDLALRTGLRRGELLGLRWSDVDFTTGILSVRQTVQRLRHTGGVIIQPTKTKASDRRIPLPADSLRVLEEHRHRQQLHRKAAGDNWHETGLVFTNTIGGACDPGALNKNFAAICDLAGVRRVRFHDLRHTCATLLLDQGVELITISNLLGHARIGITADVYAHVRLRLQRDAIEAMGAILNPDNNPSDDNADEHDEDDPRITA